MSTLGIYFLILIIIIVCFLVYDYFNTSTDSFVSLGTIIDLQSKDSQDYYLNGNGIAPYANNNYLYGMNMSTRGTNRGSNMLKKDFVDTPPAIYDSAYCFGTDFYDNGKCGQVFVSDDFQQNNNNNTIYPTQYSGDYVASPFPDIMRPLNIYSDHTFV